MKILIVTSGECRNSPILKLQQQYLLRINRYTTIKMIELKEKIADTKKQFVNLTSYGDCVIALDENGKQFDSMAFSRYISDKLEKFKRLVFLIGGAEGIPSELHELINEKISLSKMTIQHDLASLIFLEQLYRAFTIIKGEPYHK